MKNDIKPLTTKTVIKTTIHENDVSNETQQHSPYSSPTATATAKAKVKNNTSKGFTKRQLKNNAKNYETIEEWKRFSSKHYIAARRLGLLKECTKHMEKTDKSPKPTLPAIPKTKCKPTPTPTPTPTHDYSIDDCIAEAEKFTSLNEWINKSPATFDTAKKNKWLTACIQNYTKN
tara:strand:+ start:1229 stop:1753 length:525 start_codon:yes stop_codon:yes gene_type:complete